MTWKHYVSIFVSVIVFLIFFFSSSINPQKVISTLPKIAEPRSVHVPILVYHNVRPSSSTRKLSPTDQQYEVTPEQFDAELAFLAHEGYAAVSFDDVVAAINGGADLPKKAVVITLDDGRESQYVYALPLLKKYGYKATFFIFTNAIGREGYFTWDQLKEMRDEGMAIEAHTKTHLFLTRITSDAELREQIVDSKKIIEEKLGITVKHFAFPFGLYDDRVIKEVKDAGFISARGLRHVTYAGPEDLFSLGGFIVTGDIRYFRGAILDSKR